MRVINKIKKIVSETGYLAKAAKCMSPFLEKGTYTLKSKKIIKGFGFPFFIVSKSPAAKAVTAESIDLFYGGWSEKILAFTEDYVYSFYSKKRKKEIQYVEKYLDSIHYPQSKIYDISTQKLYTIAEMVKGVSHSDLDYNIRVAKDIIGINATAEKFTKHRFPIVDKNELGDVPFYLQHGDLTFKNIIWTDEENYKIIDFDTIDIFPCFYDLFRLLIDLGKDGIKLYFNGEFDAEIKNYIDLNNISYDLDTFKDRCLAAFILCTYNFWDTASLVKDLLTERYPKSTDIIKHL